MYILHDHDIIALLFLHVHAHCRYVVRWFSPAKMRKSGREYFEAIHPSHSLDVCVDRVVHTFGTFAHVLQLLKETEYDAFSAERSLQDALLQFQNTAMSTWKHQKTLRVPNLLAMFQFASSREYLGSPVFAGSTSILELSHSREKEVRTHCKKIFFLIIV